MLPFIERYGESAIDDAATCHMRNSLPFTRCLKVLFRDWFCNLCVVYCKSLAYLDTEVQLANIVKL